MSSYKSDNPQGNAHFYALFLGGRKSILISEVYLSYMEPGYSPFQVKL